MESKVIIEKGDVVAIVNGVEVFRGNAGRIVERAYGIVEAANSHVGEYRVESHVRDNKRVYFVKAGDVVLKESPYANRIHDFADRLNGATKDSPVPSEPHVEQAPQAEPQADDEDPFADE